MQARRVVGLLLVLSAIVFALRGGLWWIVALALVVTGVAFVRGVQRVVDRGQRGGAAVGEHVPGGVQRVTHGRERRHVRRDRVYRLRIIRASLEKLYAYGAGATG